MLGLCPVSEEYPGITFLINSKASPMEGSFNPNQVIVLPSAVGIPEKKNEKGDIKIPQNVIKEASACEYVNYFIFSFHRVLQPVGTHPHLFASTYICSNRIQLIILFFF